MSVDTDTPAPRRARRPRQEPSLADRAVDRLRRMIVRGALPPGARIAEPELCETLGISRTPLREALKLLASEGLVMLRRNRSAIVSPLDGAALPPLFEVEAGVEGFAARLAAARMTATDLKRLHTLQERLEAAHAAGDLTGYFDINQIIHRSIVAGAKNRALVDAHDRLFGPLERARFLALAFEGRLAESVLEHRSILDALVRRDADAAGTLLSHHITRTGEVMAGAPSPVPTEGPVDP